jgi:hypothetical protein
MAYPSRNTAVYNTQNRSADSHGYILLDQDITAALLLEDGGHLLVEGDIAATFYTLASRNTTTYP